MHMDQCAIQHPLVGVLVEVCQARSKALLVSLSCYRTDVIALSVFLNYIVLGARRLIGL